MALKVGELYGVLGLRDQGFSSGLAKAHDAMQRAEGASKALLGVLSGIGAGMVAAAGRGVVLAGQMEQTKIAFTTMLGSAKEAERFVQQLWDFAARTPFEFEGLTNAARQLLAFGFQAKEVIPLAEAVGDAVSALGGGAAEIDRVIRALGQMRAKGKVSAEEMMQLAELGIPAWEMLAEAIGTSIPEAMERASKGAIPAAVGINAIVEGMAKRFAGSMEAQSKTLLGRWGRFKDAIDGILRSIGEQIIKTFDLGGILERASNALDAFGEALHAKGLRGALAELVPPWLSAVIFSVAGAIGGALVPAIVSLAKAAYQSFLSLRPFLGWGMAIGLLAYLIYRNWDKLVALWQRLYPVVAPGLQAIKGVFEGVVSYVTTRWQQIAPTVQAVLERLRPLFTVILGGALQMLKGWVQGIVNILSGWAKIAGGIIKGLVALFTGDWQGAWNALKQIFSGSIQVIVGMFQASFIGRILGLLAVLGGKIIGWARSAWGALVGAVQRVMDIFSALREYFVAIVEDGDYLNDWLTHLPGFMQPVVRVLGELLAKVIEFATRIPDMWQAALEFFRNLPGMIVSFLSTLPERLAGIIGFAIGAAIKFIRDLPVHAHNAMVSLVQALVRGFTAAKNWAITLVTNLVRAVVEWFRQLPGRVTAFVSNLYQRAVFWFNLTKERVVNAVVTTITTVVNWFRSLPGRIVSAISSIPGRVRSYFDRTKGQALASVNGLTSGVRSLLNDIPGIFSRVFDRVWSIIKQWPTKLWNKAKSIAESFWNGFKRGLGIRSPSYIERAFMAIDAQAWDTVDSLRRAARPIRQIMAQAVAPTIGTNDLNAPKLTPVLASAGAAPISAQPVYLNVTLEINDEVLARKLIGPLDQLLAFRQGQTMRARGMIR